jgi:hypothetical protein
MERVEQKGVIPSSSSKFSLAAKYSNKERKIRKKRKKERNIERIYILSSVCLLLT